MGTHNLLASEYFWQDFSKIYQTEIRVCHDEKATVAVDIPFNYLEMYEEVTLVAV